MHLPTLNASLNATSAAFLALGFVFIRTKRISAHKICMLGAFICSTLFLASYLYYHFQVGATKFDGPAGLRPFYFTVLISHTILAMAALPVILVTLFKAWKEDFTRHARWARWAWPVWMYVSLTGVLVYWMLYRL
jgi:putative membrane protein